MIESYRPKRPVPQQPREAPDYPLNSRQVRTNPNIHSTNHSQIVYGGDREPPSLHFSQSIPGSQPVLGQKPQSQRPSPRVLKDEEAPSQITRSLYDEKEHGYKMQIQELQDRYESLKLKHKQALMSISHLHGKLKMFLSEDQINSQAIKIVAEQTEKSYREVYETLRQRTENILARHQGPVRRLLEQYGCSYEESSLEGYKSEAEVIDMLIARFSDKADVLREYEAQMSQKLASSQEQFVKLQDSVKYIVETNDLYKIRQTKYKEKMDEVRQDWQQVCEKLARKDLESEQWENQNYALKERVEQLEFELSKYELNSNSKHESDNAQVRALQSQLADMTNRVSQIHLKYQHLYAAYEEAQLTIEELTIKDKMREGEFERISRQAVRWKERYDWLEKERYHSLEIIQSENQKLRDEVLRDNKPQLRHRLEEPLRSIEENSHSRENLTHQYSLRPANNINIEDQDSGYNGDNSQPAFGGKYAERQASQEDLAGQPFAKQQRSKQNVSRKRYTEQPVTSEMQSLTSPSNVSVVRKGNGGEASGLDTRMKRIEEEMSRRGIKAGPADQRLEELLKEFESKLWKMQENPSLPTE